MTLARFFTICLFMVFIYVPTTYARYGISLGFGGSGVENNDDAKKLTFDYMMSYYKLEGLAYLNDKVSILADTVFVIDPSINYMPIRGYSFYVSYNILGNSLWTNSSTDILQTNYYSRVRVFLGTGIQLRIVKRLNPNQDDYRLSKGASPLDRVEDELSEVDKELYSEKYFQSEAIQFAVQAGASYNITFSQSFAFEFSYPLAKSVIEHNYKYEWTSTYDMFVKFVQLF